MIKSNNPFPSQEEYSTPPCSGDVFEVHHFCQKQYNHKCKAHYENISGTMGFHVCPYGFTTHITQINGKTITNTCLLIEEESNRKLARKSLSSKDFNVEISKARYQNILSNFEKNQQQVTALKNLLRDDKQQQNKNEQKSKLIDNTLHEVRKLNAQIKKQSELLKQNSTNYTNSKLNDLSKNIFSTSQLISTRLDSYDFTINPTLIDMYNRRPMAVYKKFEKAYHCLKQTAFERNLQINLKNESTTELSAYRIFELLPFMLFENAIKYSPKNREINCFFHEQNKKLKSIIIDNYGPKLEPGEIHIITDKGIRGKNAYNVEGSGIGLYLARLICEYHSIELNISQFGTEKTIDGIIYLGFKISLIFQ